MYVFLCLLFLACGFDGGDTASADTAAVTVTMTTGSGSTGSVTTSSTSATTTTLVTSTTSGTSSTGGVPERYGSEAEEIPPGTMECLWEYVKAQTEYYCADTPGMWACQGYADREGDGYGDANDGGSREDYSYICPGEELREGYTLGPDTDRDDWDALVH